MEEEGLLAKEVCERDCLAYMHGPVLWPAEQTFWRLLHLQILYINIYQLKQCNNSFLFTAIKKITQKDYY